MGEGWWEDGGRMVGGERRRMGGVGGGGGGGRVDKGEGPRKRSGESGRILGRNLFREVEF